MRVLYDPFAALQVDKRHDKLSPARERRLGPEFVAFRQKAVKAFDAKQGGQKTRKPTGGSATKSFLTSPGLGETFGDTSVRRKTLGGS